MKLTRNVATETTAPTSRAAGQRKSHETFSSSLPEHHYPQIWLLVVTVAAFALYVAHDLGLLKTIVALDRSYIASVIGALALLASCHAAWHIFLFSQRIEASRRALEGGTGQTSTAADPFLSTYLSDLDDAAVQTGRKVDKETAESDSVIEIYADGLRSPVDLGWFLVDLTVRLGLVGTIIGFILIFTSLTGISIDGSEGLQELLVTMSGGMGTALFTTLSGLVGATFLSLQYLILGREAETLIGLLVRLRNRNHSAAT